MSWELCLAAFCVAFFIASFFLRKHPKLKWLWKVSFAIIPFAVLFILSAVKNFSAGKKEEGSNQRGDDLREEIGTINTTIQTGQSKAVAVEAANLQKIEDAKRKAEEASKRAEEYNRKNAVPPPENEAEQVDDIVNDLNKRRGNG